MAASSERYVPAAGLAFLTRSYDRTVALTMREPRWRVPLVEAVGRDLPRGGTAVEVGCGTGALTLALAAARPDASVVGVDGDPEILALAGRKPGADDVTWHRALADALPLGDESADVALISLVLHHLTDAAKRAALAEIARVLRPGGALHVADWGPPGGPLVALGARALQLFDGAAGPGSLLAGRLPLLLTESGLADPVRHGSLRTVWGTLELWRAVRPTADAHTLPERRT